MIAEIAFASGSMYRRDAFCIGAYTSSGLGRISNKVKKGPQQVQQQSTPLATAVRELPRGLLALFIVPGLMVLLLSGCGTRTAVDPGASARFEKPASWTWVAGETEDAHPVAVAPAVISSDLEREDKVQANINLRQVAFDGSPQRMPDWIRRNVEFTTNTLTVTRSYSMVAGEPTAFETTAGLAGYRVVLQNRRFHRRLVHIQYFFLEDGIIDVLTFTRPVLGPERDKELDRLADEAVRTLE